MDHLTAIEAAQNFHARVMNIPALSHAESGQDAPSKAFYLLGHKDARHAAAEIANEADEAIRSLLARLREAEVDAARLRVASEAALFWKALYRRAINEANGLTNYVEDRPELRSAERRLTEIEADARAAISKAGGHS